MPIISVPSARMKNAAMAASGAVNLLGTNMPAANPRAVNAGMLTAPTAAGHHSGPPQCAWLPVTA